MTLKSYLLLSGGGLLATYLFTSQGGLTPERPPSASRPAASRAGRESVNIQDEAARLQARVRQEVEYAEPSRNPFRFGARSAPSPSARTVREPSEEAPPITVAPPSPAIQLSGIGSTGGTRTAYLMTAQGLLIGVGALGWLGTYVFVIANPQGRVARLRDRILWPYFKALPETVAGAGRSMVRTTIDPFRATYETCSNLISLLFRR